MLRRAIPIGGCKLGLIVNADDFGISQEVNKAIALAFSKGMINRTTLMVNMPYAAEAMEIAKREGFISKVGIHLNLTAGRPLNEELSKDAVMCDEKGQFTADFARNMKTRFFLPKATSRRVIEEIRLQLQAYGDLGGSLWHMDSHHHVHTDPSVWKAVMVGAKTFTVSSVRLGRNMYKGGNPLMHVYKWILNKSINSFSKKKSNYFGSMQDYQNWIKGMEKSQIQDFIAKNQVEIMVHPMFNEAGELVDSMEEFPLVLQ